MREQDHHIIRYLWSSGKMTQQEIAKMFNISQAYASQICNSVAKPPQDPMQKIKRDVLRYFGIEEEKPKPTPKQYTYLTKDENDP